MASWLRPSMSLGASTLLVSPCPSCPFSFRPAGRERDEEVGEGRGAASGANLAPRRAPLQCDSQGGERKCLPGGPGSPGMSPRWRPPGPPSMSLTLFPGWQPGPPRALPCGLMSHTSGRAHGHVTVPADNSLTPRRTMYLSRRPSRHLPHGAQVPERSGQPPRPLCFLPVTSLPLSGL